jgi:hypothetical protein
MDAVALLALDLRDLVVGNRDDHVPDIPALAAQGFDIGAHRYTHAPMLSWIAS